MCCSILRRTIQQGSHDSIDDARATMELVLLKIKNGPLWDKGGRNEGAPLPAALAQRGHRCCLVDCATVVRKYMAGDSSGIVAESDDEAVRAATNAPLHSRSQCAHALSSAASRGLGR